MPNIFHQSVEDILKAATPEQRLLWNYVFLQYGERASISQLFYIGSGLSAPYYAFTARRMFLAYELMISGNGVIQVAPTAPILYNEAGLANFQIQNNSVVWDATAAALRYYANDMIHNNLLFSRCTGGAWHKFIGYMINY